eukprot:scpid82407/ scgid24325/ 
MKETIHPRPAPGYQAGDQVQLAGLDQRVRLLKGTGEQVGPGWQEEGLGRRVADSAEEKREPGSSPSQRHDQDQQTHPLAEHLANNTADQGELRKGVTGHLGPIQGQCVGIDGRWLIGIIPA